MSQIRKHLAEYLLRCNHYEAMAERLRQKIAENPYFQIETIFERLDKFKKGYLVPDDFAEFMLDNQLYPTGAELYLIFRDFDKERVGVVTLQRLADQILPKENPKLHKKATERKYYQSSLRLELDLEFLISKYFTHKIQQTKQLTMIRVQMFQKQVFTVEQAFTLIDQHRQGVISQLQQLDRFLRSNGKVLTNSELGRIFRVLSFDSGDAILYETFSQHLDPLGKGYYIGYAQRMAEKELIHRDYFKKKLELTTEAARNSRQRLILDNTLIDLHEGNRRLGDHLKRQEIQQLKQQQELMALRFRRQYL